MADLIASGVKGLEGIDSGRKKQIDAILYH